MVQENKELLLKDLSARLLYGVKVQINSDVKKVVGVKNGFVVTKERGLYSTKEYITRIECCIPYLRPMSSMTEEEKEELKQISNDYLDEWENAKTPIERLKLDAKVSYKRAMFYNSHHFDWNDLIPKGLAIEAQEGMYK